MGNFETGGQSIVHSDVAEASLYCVSGKWQLFLATMAANRAFARCVRAFLGIGIYGKDEFDPEANKAFEDAVKKGENPLISATKVKTAQGESSGPQATDPIGVLKKICSERKIPITFEALKARATEIKTGWVDDPSTWVSFDSIGRRDCFTLSVMIQKADEVKAKKK